MSQHDKYIIYIYDTYLYIYMIHVYIYIYTYVYTTREHNGRPLCFFLRGVGILWHHFMVVNSSKLWFIWVLAIYYIYIWRERER